MCILMQKNHDHISEISLYFINIGIRIDRIILEGDYSFEKRNSFPGTCPTLFEGKSYFPGGTHQ